MIKLAALAAMMLYAGVVENDKIRGGDGINLSVDHDTATNCETIHAG
jgi:hypothetical protein